MNSGKKQGINNLLSICIKAGRAVKGFDSAKEAVLNGKAYCVLTACDASGKTVKEIQFVCSGKNIPVIDSGLEKSEIARLCGKETAVIAVCDRGFAQGFSKFTTQQTSP